MKKISSAILLLSLLPSCAALNNFNKPSELDSISKGAKFDIKKFFEGDVEGFAIIQDSSGKIIDTEALKINGKWDGNKGVIQQNFVYASGNKDSRTWLITMDESGSTFSAIGHDIAAPAQGKQVGNAMQMIYALMLPGKMDKQKVKVNFEDKIYLVDDESAIMISNFAAGFSSPSKSIISLKKVKKAE